MLILFTKLIVVIYLYNCCSASKPVVIVPGLFGSSLYGKAKASEGEEVCINKANFTYLWADLEKMRNRSFRNCALGKLKLKISEYRHVSYSDEVDVITNGFGFPAIDESFPAGEMDTIMNGLKNANLTIGAAPYDFRKGPDQQGEYFHKLKILVELAYEHYGQNKIVLVGYSMGGTMVVSFLNHQTAEWKSKYIDAFISLASPFGGSVKSLRTIISGANDLPFFRGSVVRDIVRTFPGMYYLFPLQRLWMKCETIITTTNTSYTMHNLEALFKDIQYEVGFKLWKNQRPFLESLWAPGVETHCIQGSGVKTEERMTYKKGFPNRQPFIEYGNGDGVVNARSLEVCKQWRNYQDQKVNYVTVDKLNHQNIINDKRIIDMIVSIAK